MNRKELARLLIRVTCRGFENESRREFLEMSVADRDLFVSMAVAHGLGPMLYRQIQQQKILLGSDGEFLVRLRDSYLVATTETTRQLTALAPLLKLAASYDMEVIALKGVALLAMVYEDPGLRPMNDVDLLVRKEDFDRMSELLQGEGYRENTLFENQFVEETIGHIDPGWKTFRKGNVVIDLHARINMGSGTRMISAEAMINRSNLLEFEGMQIPCPLPESMLLHLIVHLDKHLQKGFTRFSNLVDIFLILEKYREHLDWEEFRHLGELTGTLITSNNWLNYLSGTIGAPVPRQKVISTEYKKHVARMDRWLQKGERKVVPVVPPWKRPEYGETSGNRRRARYILSVLFPSPAYIIQVYGVRKKWLVPLLYPYRLVERTARYLVRKSRPNSF